METCAQGHQLPIGWLVYCEKCQMKRCSICGLWKRVKQFYRDPTRGPSQAGVYPSCIGCKEQNHKARQASRYSRLLHSRTFVAIDFETADYGADSACAIGLVKVDGDRIVRKEKFLIRPPRCAFVWTGLHGIAWSHVSRKPTFKQLWPTLSKWLNDADFIAAHNASFDIGVLNACSRRARIALPEYRSVCTVRLARNQLGIRPANLPNVCAELGIRLNHHDPLSDAVACAKIVIAARKVEAVL